MITEKPDLSDEDKQRVEEYLSQPMHQVEGRSFNPFMFVLLTVGSVVGLGLLAFIVTVISGVEVESTNTFYYKLFCNDYYCLLRDPGT